MRTPERWAIGFIIVFTIGGMLLAAYVGANRTLQDPASKRDASTGTSTSGLVSRSVRRFRPPVLFLRKDHFTYSGFVAIVHFWLSFISAAILVRRNLG